MAVDVSSGLIFLKKKKIIKKKREGLGRLEESGKTLESELAMKHE